MTIDERLRPRAGSEPARVHVGTMNFGKRTPARDAERIVRRALDRGVACFDTANVYADGESERILGKALGRDRDRVIVATKVGVGRLGRPAEGLAPERVLAAIDESLARLGTDHVDVYYLHLPDPKTPIDETLSAMKAILDAGKARAWGVSNYASWQILEMRGISERIGMPPPAMSQLLYNALIRQLDLEYFRFAARFPIHTTIYNPLAGGLLAGRHKADGTTLAGSRFDRNTMYQQRYLSETFFRAVEELGAIASDAGVALVDLAYAWVASRPGVDSILVGPASTEHLDAALDACSLHVASEVLAKVDRVHRKMVGTDASYAR